MVITDDVENPSRIFSPGIVTFDVMRDFFTEFDREVNAPIWLVGLDCK